MTEHKVYKKLFARPCDELFKLASSEVRGGQAFANTLVMKILLANSSVVIDGAVAKVFGPDTIPESMRSREEDSFYPHDEHWLIQCGEERMMTYDSKRFQKGEGVKAIHGYCTAPAGWLRFAIKADHVDWRTWHKAYYTIAGSNVKRIIEQGIHPKGKYICVSPSIEYSSHYLDTEQQAIRVGVAARATTQ